MVLRGLAKAETPAPCRSAQESWRSALRLGEKLIAVAGPSEQKMQSPTVLGAFGHVLKDFLIGIVVSELSRRRGTSNANIGCTVSWAGHIRKLPFPSGMPVA